MLFNFGLDDYQAFSREFEPNHRVNTLGYAYVVSFRDGSMGVVLKNGYFFGEDRVWSNPPYTVNFPNQSK